MNSLTGFKLRKEKKLGIKKALAILAISFNTTTLAVVFLVFYFWSVSNLAMCSDTVLLSGVVAIIMNLIFASMIQVNKKP